MPQISCATWYEIQTFGFVNASILVIKIGDVEGCIKTFQSLAAIQKHPNKGKHSEADKEIRLRYDQEKMDEDRLAILKGVATFKVGPQVNF